MSKTEIIRCLKRYVAREVSALLPAPDRQPSRRSGLRPLDIYRGFHAAPESFHSTLEFELLRKHAFATKVEARAAP